MISAKEALESHRVRLTEREADLFQRVEALITATIRDQFTGLPFNVPFPVAECPARVVFAIKRRFERPADDGSRWAVAAVAMLDGETVTGYRLTFEPAPPSDFPAPVKREEIASSKIGIRVLADEVSTIVFNEETAKNISIGNAEQIADAILNFAADVSSAVKRLQKVMAMVKR